MISASYQRLIRCAPAALLLAGIAGCGGPDIGAGGRSSSFDNGLSGGFGGSSFGSSNFGSGGGGRQAPGARGLGTYPKQELSFELPDVKGNPFDYTENDVVVTFGTPDGRSIKYPAFFDGGKTWRVRFTPDMAGHYTASRVSLNGTAVNPDKMEKRELDITGTPQPGFVRHDPRDKTRFAFDNGTAYFPIGNNCAWGSGKPGDVAGLLEKMGRAGENWSRIWMCHWDNKNLDWPADSKQKLEPGAYSLDVARRWDEIVEAAEKSGIYFQMVLQHHGPYSSRVDSNWGENPWNKKNGGFLSTPDEFFTNSRAIGLTKAKYRYIVARWGYSTAIMAWELFNEVENTDSIFHKHADEVASWHDAMAAFLRQQDPYRHLVTTSSSLELAGLWQNMDYVQPHTYRGDPVFSAQLPTAKRPDRPLFYGEAGPNFDPGKEVATWLHRALWSSLMSDASGTAQYWDWDGVDKNNLYEQFQGVADFVKRSGFAGKRGLLSAAVTVETKERAALSFGPGAGWGGTKQTEFLISPSGTVAGLAQMPAYLQGSSNRDLFPSATFPVNYPADGTFAVTVSQVAKAGGTLEISVDGKSAGRKAFPAADRDTSVNATLEVKVPAGTHTVRVENTGADWVVVRRITLSPYAPALGALGRAGKDFAALWVYRREPGEAGVTGKATIPGLQSGAYKVTWWDPATGKATGEETATVTGKEALTLTIPAVTRDLAAYVTRGGEKPAARKPDARTARGRQGDKVKG